MCTSKIGMPPTGLRDLLIRDVLDFVYEQLPLWRDDPSRLQVESEPKLNSQLETFLSAQSYVSEKPYTFDQEEYQTGSRRIDIAAKPLAPLISASGFDSIYHPITVIEAKRLPAPVKPRKKEYVTGEEDDKQIPGGIQRFKLLLHGADHTLAGMVGYIQEETHQYHLKQINDWICELSNGSKGEWTLSELLVSQDVDMASGRSRFSSRHYRKDGTSIHLSHMWVDMNSKCKA